MSASQTSFQLPPIVVDVPTLLAPAESLMPRRVTITHLGSDSQQQQQQQRRRRRSRWDAAAEPGSFSASLAQVTGAPQTPLPARLSAAQEDALLVRLRLEETACVVAANAAAAAAGRPLPALGARERSPSPPPVYDRDGKRTNTREQRVRERIGRERWALVQAAQRIDPGFRAPADFARVPRARHVMKVHVPEREFPDYNFIGLVIGPRGNTQKRLEQESGAKVSIRGRGSLKEGKQKHAGPSAGASAANAALPTAAGSEDEEPLYVLIVAESEEAMNKAYNMVHPLLIPVDESKNEWKRAQLRELAEYNGTLRSTVTWYGGGAGMPHYDAGVSCAICGDQGHPTSDCPFRGKDGSEIPVPAKRQRVDSEFDSFMSEIGESVPTAAAAAAASSRAAKSAEDAALDDFMASIGSDAQQSAAPTASAADIPREEGPPGTVEPPAPLPPELLPAAPPPPGMGPPPPVPAAMGMPQMMPQTYAMMGWPGAMWPQQQ